MLNEKRIKEAESNVRNYLREGLLAKQSFQEIVFSVLKSNAKESLETANFLSKNSKSDLWIIVASYYSMFYIANAVLYKLGYKVGEKIAHRVTADSLIVFVRKKLADSLLESYEDTKDSALAAMKSDELLESFDSERKKRSIVQYKTTDAEKKNKALISLQRAKEFMLEMEKLLSD